MIVFTISQWLIDTVGKLGPLSVAIAVYLASKRHNAWTSGAIVRTANLEDQKLRLNLLDRRLTVISHLRVARDKTGPIMLSSDALGAVLDALREAELIFEDEDQKAINHCLRSVISYQNRFGGIFTELAGAELVQATDAYSFCLNDINRVIGQLREAARIRELAPLTAPR
jgi:hypothetical protein